MHRHSQSNRMTSGERNKSELLYLLVCLRRSLETITDSFTTHIYTVRVNTRSNAEYVIIMGVREFKKGEHSRPHNDGTADEDISCLDLRFINERVRQLPPPRTP
jgi:hypothetical protein